jgi:hypothetical protein
MSSRSRREYLRDMRLRALVQEYIDPPDDIKSMEDWNLWVRGSFRCIQRRPLTARGERGRDGSLDPGLSHIQVRNRPRGFHPLIDEIEPPPDDLSSLEGPVDPLWVWQEASDLTSQAVDVLAPARRSSRTCFSWEAWALDREFSEQYGDNGEAKDPAMRWMVFADYYPVRYQVAFRTLRGGLSAVRQYGDRYAGPGMSYARVATQIFSLDDRISEQEIFAFFVLAVCCKILDALRSGNHRWAGFLDDSQRLFADARRWLAEANHLINADARVLKEQQRAHSDRSKRGGEKKSGPEGIHLLAKQINDENPRLSAGRLFDIAYAECKDAGDAGLEANGFRVKAEIDSDNNERLVSYAPDSRDGWLPEKENAGVRKDNWKKRYIDPLRKPAKNRHSTTDET